MRVRFAKDLVANGIPISQAAVDAGFFDQAAPHEALQADLRSDSRQLSLCELANLKTAEQLAGADK